MSRTRSWASSANRVQHALRAFTPDDAAALSKAVRTFPKTADYDLAELLTQLGTGESRRPPCCPTAALRLRWPGPGSCRRGHRWASSTRPRRKQAVDFVVVEREVRHRGRPQLGLRDAGRQARAGGPHRPPGLDQRTTKERAAPGRTVIPHSDEHGGHHGGELAAAGGVVAAVLGSSAFKSFCPISGQFHGPGDNPRHVRDGEATPLMAAPVVPDPLLPGPALRLRGVFPA